MIDFIYVKLIKLIEWFGSPRRTRGKETEEVLKLKKYYEEQSAEDKNKRNNPPD